MIFPRRCVRKRTQYDRSREDLYSLDDSPVEICVARSGRVNSNDTGEGGEEGSVAVTNLSGLARETCLSVSQRDIIRDSRGRDGGVPPVPRENGYLDSWTVRGRPEDERRRCRRPDLREMQGARGGFGGQKMGRERGSAAAASRESPYSCHPEFLGGRMTSLSSYGFVFGSADSIGTSEGSSLGTFFLDLPCPRLSHKDGRLMPWLVYPSC